MSENEMLGKEPIGKLLLKFSVPCVMGLLISALYNIVDQIFIGNSSLGYVGNAATGISFPVICIANAVSWCVGDGASAYLSISSGRKDSESAHKCIGTGLSTTFIISIILAIISLSFCGQLMKAFGASDESLPLAKDYFYIIAAFFPVYLMINVMNGMIRADGSPAYAMISILSGCIINIILDPIFIFVLDWGIKGAAFATVIGQTISFIFSAAYFFKPKTFKLKKSSFKIDFSMLKNLITLGGSTFIIQISVVVMMMVSYMTLSKYGALSKYGKDIPMSVYSIQSKVYTIVNNIVVGIALGGQPILGYNYGAKKYDRVKKTYKCIFISAITTGIIATLIFELCPQIIIRLFGNGNELYMEFAKKSFRIFLSLCIITCFSKISSIFFQSIGKAIQAMTSSIIRDMICLVSFTIIFSATFEHLKPGTGVYGILFAAPVADIVAGTVITILILRFFKHLKVEIEEENNKAIEDDKNNSLKESHPGVIITIAREHGTCGKRIGKMVAEAMNIPFYSKEVAAMTAYESGLAKEFVSEDSKETSTLFHQIYLSTKVIQEGAIAQEKVLKKIADQGACVIVGRAADYVLREYKNILRVFIYAPEEVRIKNISKMYGDSEENARKNMIASDNSRGSYYREISGKEWLDMSNYDLCIDASSNSENIINLIVTFAKKAELELDLKSE